MDYYALKWEKHSTSSEIDEKLPFGKESQALQSCSLPTFQAKSGTGRLKKSNSRLVLHNFGQGQEVNYAQVAIEENRYSGNYSGSFV